MRSLAWASMAWTHCCGRIKQIPKNRAYQRMLQFMKVCSAFTDDKIVELIFVLFLLRFIEIWLIYRQRKLCAMRSIAMGDYVSLVTCGAGFTFLVNQKKNFNHMRWINWVVIDDYSPQMSENLIYMQPKSFINCSMHGAKPKFFHTKSRHCRKSW